MIDSDGYTKLCDFGLSLAPQNIHPEQSIADDASSSSSVSSSSVTSMTTSKEGKKVSTTTFFGTLEYLPPEFFHKRIYSGQSDLWAFGCLIYELLVGLPPFMDAKGNNRNTIYRILRKSFSPKSDLLFSIGRDSTWPTPYQNPRESKAIASDVWFAFKTA